jgi:hypothetical protein
MPFLGNEFDSTPFIPPPKRDSPNIRAIGVVVRRKIRQQRSLSLPLLATRRKGKIRAGEKKKLPPTTEDRMGLRWQPMFPSHVFVFFGFLNATA